jgi:carbon-monoxide dehydrogenase medium subunit
VDYVAPATVDDALRVLRDAPEDAKVIAGGQSLIPLLRLRFAAPEVLVDIRRLPGMRGIHVDGSTLVVGAMTRHADVIRSTLVQARCPVLATAAQQIADPQVRNLGTVGGALAHADPEGDWASVMLALRAELTLVSPRGERTVPMRDFLMGMFTSVLAPDELLTSVRVPIGAPRQAGDYLKLSRRVGDFAAVGVAVQVQLQERGRLRKQLVIEQAGIALTALGPINTACVEAEDALRGQAPSDQMFELAADLAARSANPHSDGRGSAEYKRAVVREYVRRGLRNSCRAATATAD